MAAFDFDLAIGTTSPGLQLNELVSYYFVIRRALDWVRNCGKEDVGLTGADVLYGGLDVGQLLVLVAPHEKHAALDAAFTAHGNCLLYLLQLHTAIHGVENALRAAF